MAHIWGRQTYTDNNTARDNGFLALFTFGESYHNYHHMFENDYRNGIRWWHFDPTKWLIKTCYYIKLTSNLRVAPEDKIEKAKLSMVLKRNQLKLKAHPNADLLLTGLQREYDELLIRFNAYYAAKKQLIARKRQKFIYLASYLFCQGPTLYTL